MKSQKMCLIIGYGISGRGVARLLVNRNIPFVIMDENLDRIHKNQRHWVAQHNSKFVSLENICDYLDCNKIAFSIVSPGISADHIVTKMLIDRKIPIYGELEYAVSLLAGLKIGVTGTNGKTSVVNMIYEALKAQSVNVSMAGNIGFSASEAVLKQIGNGVIVLEISSFQLERADRLILDGALITNIAQDHLSRYRDFREYIRVKTSISNRVKQGGFIIYHCLDRQWIKPMLPDNINQYELGSINHTTLPFAVDDNCIWMRNNSGWTKVLSDSDLNVRGVHMLSNIAMALSSISLLGYDNSASLEAMQAFSGVPHRLEWVARINDVDYFNDSKATNPNATEMALDSFDMKNIILILGGRDKNVSLVQLRERIRDKVKMLILIGESAGLYADYFGKIVPMVEADNLCIAVQHSYELAKPNDVVLLSPACASFDMFDNFEVRGNKFKEYVTQLVKN